MKSKAIYTNSAKAQYSQYKSRGDRFGDSGFSLDISDFEKLKQQVCYLCGEQATGFDRIDSGHGYTRDNTLPCCGRCNAMKSDLPLSEFLAHVAKIMGHLVENVRYWPPFCGYKIFSPSKDFQTMNLCTCLHAEEDHEHQEYDGDELVLIIAECTLCKCDYFNKKEEIWKKT